MILRTILILLIFLTYPAFAATEASVVPQQTESQLAPTELPVTSVPSTTTSSPSVTNNSSKGFSPLPTADKGRVLISGVRIPKTEGAVSAFYLFAMLSTPKTDVPFNVTIYDVTNEPILIGEMSGSQHGGITPSMHQNTSGWMEVDLPIGKHTLMLANEGFTKGTALHTDFIEVMVEPNQVKHVSISQYGFMRFAYFGEILLAQKHYDFCTSLPGVDNSKKSEVRNDEFKKLKESIDAYMLSNAISAKATDFSDYCQTLTQQQPIHIASANAIKKFETDKTSPQKIKESNFKTWQAQIDKPLRYDLMREHEEPKKVETGLVYAQ